jgi:hypothetical protein
LSKETATDLCEFETSEFDLALPIAEQFANTNAAKKRHSVKKSFILKISNFGCDSLAP